MRHAPTRGRVSDWRESRWRPSKARRGWRSRALGSWWMRLRRTRSRWPGSCASTWLGGARVSVGARGEHLHIVRDVALQRVERGLRTKFEREQAAEEGRKCAWRMEQRDVDRLGITRGSSSKSSSGRHPELVVKVAVSMDRRSTRASE
mmetsp:Transcript_16762/g.47823  ORF Transcript_16762/g.47823 Transcript_16762/m.47823 type:complete len:148 (-) Transcript_16762:59-502(-)